MYVCDAGMIYGARFCDVDDDLFLSLSQEYIKITSNHQHISTVEKFNYFYANISMLITPKPQINI